jgi:hypothetical protein
MPHRFVSILLLMFEFARYLLRSSGGKQFYDVLLVRLVNGNLPAWSRSFSTAFIITSALNHSDYDAALKSLHCLEADVPWRAMSLHLVREIFEVALISDDRSIAQRCMNEMNERGDEGTGSNLFIHWLIRWRFEGLLANEAVEVDLKAIYFVAFPEYDEYFKGSISELRGNVDEARSHFRRSLALAPINARELRGALHERINRLTYPSDLLGSSARSR